MKKLLFSVTALMIFSLLQAQEIKYGVKAGLNLSNLVSGGDNLDTRAGLHIGGVAEFKITEQFSIQPELLYSMQGGKDSGYEDGMNLHITIKMDYITIPVMAKYYVIEGLSIEVGPQIGFLTNAKIDAETADFKGSVDVNDYFKKIDFGINTGIGYSLPIGVFFQARYYIGLSDVNKYEGYFLGQEFEGDAKIKNNTFQLSVGYKF